MDEFIHRENSALFRGRLDDPGLTDAQRKAILRLLTEEHARGHTSRTLDPYQSTRTAPRLLGSRPGTPMSTWGLK